MITKSFININKKPSLQKFSVACFLGEKNK